MENVIDDLIHELSLSEDAIVLEPQETFNKGITGISSDRNHIIYDFDKLAESLSKEMTIEEAIEYLDCNTLRAISYMDQNYCPIISLSCLK